jgi:hypothetical protein
MVFGHNSCSDADYSLLTVNYQLNYALDVSQMR